MSDISEIKMLTGIHKELKAVMNMLIQLRNYAREIEIERDDAMSRYENYYDKTKEFGRQAAAKVKGYRILIESQRRGIYLRNVVIGVLSVSLMISLSINFVLANH